jgi:hypothetical protein
MFTVLKWGWNKPLGPFLQVSNANDIHNWKPLSAAFGYTAVRCPPVSWPIRVKGTLNIATGYLGVRVYHTSVLCVTSVVLIGAPVSLRLAFHLLSLPEPVGRCNKCSLIMKMINQLPNSLVEEYEVQHRRHKFLQLDPCIVQFNSVSYSLSGSVKYSIILCLHILWPPILRLRKGFETTKMYVFICPTQATSLKYLLTNYSVAKS